MVRLPSHLCFSVSKNLNVIFSVYLNKNLWFYDLEIMVSCPLLYVGLFGLFWDRLVCEHVEDRLVDVGKNVNY